MAEAFEKKTLENLSEQITLITTKTKEELDALEKEITPYQKKLRRQEMKALTIKHREIRDKIKKILPEYRRDIKKFLETFQANRERYERVAQATGIPAILVAAIHMQEASQNFSCYLHNGDPLGKPTVKKPEGIYFKEGEWERAAIHALGGDIKDDNGKPSLHYFQNIKTGLLMDKTSIKIAKMMAFAEKYNGLGYHNHNKLSPYIYSGTNINNSGVNTENGKFSGVTANKTPGIAALLISARQEKII